MYMEMLQHINPDFDDDLLMDSIALLEAEVDQANIMNE